MSIAGLHHISLISRDAQRTLDFYARLLGLRLVKQTVNFDNPTGYHLYFGDDAGYPGTLVTFFPLPGGRSGRSGVGGTHHFALQVADFENLLRWQRRLSDHGISVTGPTDHASFSVIQFRDPDGTALEIATGVPGWYRDVESGVVGGRGHKESGIAEERPYGADEIAPAMTLRRALHHVTAISSDLERTHSFFAGLLGLQLIKKTVDSGVSTTGHWYWGVGEGRHGTLVSYFQRDPAVEPRVKLGAGQTHHFALAVPDEAELRAWREKLLAADCSVTPVLDRHYFKSIYTTDPDGHIVELATAGPGFLVDEAEEALGTGLQLPPWLVARRDEIVTSLPPLQLP